MASRNYSKSLIAVNIQIVNTIQDHLGNHYVCLLFVTMIKMLILSNRTLMGLVKTYVGSHVQPIYFGAQLSFCILGTLSLSAFGWC